MISDISNVRDGKSDTSSGHVVFAQNTSEISTMRSLVKAEKSTIEFDSPRIVRQDANSLQSTYETLKRRIDPWC